MNRSTFILGISLLVVAVTMAVTITVRNAPETQAQAEISAKKGKIQSVSQRSHRSSSLRRSGAERISRAPLARERYEVVIPGDRLMSLPESQREELRGRVATVERKARKQLERMTEELELTTAQRRKMFPLLVRSSSGYDPAMQVAGVATPLDPAASTDEEIHALLDSEQQAELEDEEVNRRLWWQDLIGRLEKELVESTGGPETQPVEGGQEFAPDPTVPAPAPAAPPARPTGNLLDLPE